MTNFLTLDYWFNLRPEPLIPTAQSLLAGFVGLLIVFTIAIFFLKNRTGIYHGLFNRLYAFVLADAIIGLLYLFFEYELVPFFSARFWLALWSLTMILWLAYILKKLQEIPRLKKQIEQEMELKKYIP